MGFLNLLILFYKHILVKGHFNSITVEQLKLKKITSFHNLAGNDSKHCLYTALVNQYQMTYHLMPATFLFLVLVSLQLCNTSNQVNTP